MTSHVFRNVISIALALLLALPVGMALSENEQTNPAAVNDLAHATSDSKSIASLGNSEYRIWIEGPQHETKLMLSISHDSGFTWSAPDSLTGTGNVPMNFHLVTGADYVHVVWQDGASKLLRTGFISIDANGFASKPLMFNGESPAIAASDRDVAFSYSFSGMATVQVSHDSGASFTQFDAFEGYTTQKTRLSFDSGKLEMVAFSGLRDAETGKQSSRGIYHSYFASGAWSSPIHLTETGAVQNLSYTDGVIEWSETNDRTISWFRMSRGAAGEFTEKILVSSESLMMDSTSSPVLHSRLPPKKWTYICYLDGDNNLATFAAEDCDEMELIGSDENLNIIVLMDVDQQDGFTEDYTRAYYIEHDTTTAGTYTDSSTITSPQIPLTNINPSWGTELNMGDPQTAIDFVNYVYENYPADRYMWDMWNHGGSWLYGMCSDDTNGDDLTMVEVRSIYETLRTDNNKVKLFDVAGYDECLMSDISNDYDEIPYIDYICNSEDSIAGDGWEYNLVLGPLAANPDMSSENAAWLIFDAYVDNYGTSGGMTTMSIINSTMFFLELIPAINNLAQKGIHDITANRAALQTAANNAADWQGYTHQKDLLDFCANIVSGLPANEIRQAAQEVIDAGTANPAGTQFGAPAWQHDRAILIHNQNTGENGVTIYAASPPYDNLYDTMTFTENKWDEFYKVLWGSDASNPNAEPGVVITSPANGGTVVMDSVVTITGTASDSDGSVMNVEVAIDTEHWEPATGTGSWSFAWDTTNFALGTHYISARSYDGQDYSAPYLIEVNMVDVSSNGTIDIQMPKYPAEASVKVTVKDTDLNTGTGIQTTTITVTSIREPTGESLLLTETGGDTSVFEGFLTISGTNAAGVLWVNAADTITATYNDANYGGSGPMTLTDTADVDGTPPGPPAGLTVEWYGLVQQDFYFEDFEGDGTPTLAELGWTTGGASNDWQIGTPAGLGTPPDPVGAYGGSFSIGNDLTGLGTYPGEYENSLVAESNYIYSPAINCAGFNDIQMTFARFLGIESPSFDHANIEGSISPTGPWTHIWTNSATISDTSWSSVSYDISALADNNPAVYIRFELGATDSSVTYCGWNIDDLALSGMAGGTQHNTVNWTLSSDDGAGADDVVSYNLYRSTSESGPWDASSFIETLPKGTDTFTDPDRGEYDGINWWYLVRAEDSLGNEDSNTFAIPEIPLTNIAPSAPNTPTPSNGATGVSVNPTISVRAADPNGDLLTVRFYIAAGSILIGTNFNVPSGTFTNMVWPGLSPLTSYSWYATADDGEFVTQSSTWSFMTMDTTPPGPPVNLMVEWTGTSSATLLDEDFTTWLPAGWSELDPTDDWNQVATTNAGGTSPEAVFSWYSGINVWRLYAGPMDTTGMSSLDLSWNNYFNDYAAGVTVKVQTSSDGSSWIDTPWSIESGNGDVGPGMESIIVSTADVGSSTFYLGFTVDGNGYQLDNWYIDNVLLTYTGGLTTDDNLLTWTLSADDGAGANDVDHYNIYRADIEFGPYSVIDTVPAGTATYTDSGAGESDAITWWYIVRAEDIWGNEDSNNFAVPEIGTPPTPYDIVLTGISAPCWVMISFPLDVSDSIQDILNDATLGDGMTSWDIAKWYNPDTPADPWKTYRVGGTANDMPAVNNKMGFWLHLTANGGDQLFTLGVWGSAPSYSVNILLSPGWNLVGYPSGTERSGTATPIQVDMISVYSGSGTYDDHIDKSLVTLRPGNAYFMHVTAACTWPVDP